MRLFFALWLFVFGGFIVDAEASTLSWTCPTYSELAVNSCMDEALTDLKGVGCETNSQHTKMALSSETALYSMESSNCTNELESGCPKGYERQRMETWTDSLSSFDQAHDWEMVRVRTICKEQTGEPIS